jgi:AAA family ATP:ADP antiporter
VKYKSKSFVDTFIYRLGDCLGAWAFMGFQIAGAGLTAVAVLTIPIAGVWVFVGRVLGRKQRELTEGARSGAGDVGIAPDSAETEASAP